jgi:hypothetical protein
MNDNFFSHEAFMDRGTIAASGRPTPVNLLVNTNPNYLNQTFMTLGFLNSTYRIAGEDGVANPSSFVGVPTDPNPNAALANPNWVPLTPFWTNRSFVNSLELSMVPVSSPGQFMQEFSAIDPANANSRYLPTDDPNGFNPFRHLLSFTQEGINDGATPVRDVVPISVLFELVETPSPWSDANVHENPVPLAFRDTADSTITSDFRPVVGATNFALAPLRAPYNRISRYREPGRLNLNTLSEVNVFQGLWFNSLSLADRAALGQASVTTPWTAFATSRRGYAPGGGSLNFDPTRFNPNVPTQFAAVIKPAMEAGMTPET